jgi:hypothetical protein
MTYGGSAMIATGWSDGSPNNVTGGGYGVRISRKDREKYFQREWPSVTVELEEWGTTEANVAPSFWRSCTELRGKVIGKWLLDHGLAPWPKGNPPKLKLEPMGGRRFRLSRMMDQ